jgi:hypothetical protein
MATVASDYQQAGLKVLSAINRISMVGGSDSTISGNATIAGVISAILALPPVAGAGPDANRQIADGLQLGVDAGLLDSTHGVSTIAALAAQCQGRMTDIAVSSSYSASFPE